MTLYEKYSAIRDAKGLNDFQVAKLCNIPPSSIYDWKYGTSIPKADKMILISRAIGVPVEELIEE